MICVKGCRYATICIKGRSIATTDDHKHHSTTHYEEENFNYARYFSGQLQGRFKVICNPEMCKRKWNKTIVIHT